MLFRKYITTALVTYIAIGSMAAVAPAVSGEIQTTPVAVQSRSDTGGLMADQASGFVLLHEKNGGETIKGGSPAVFANFDALSPALLLFGGAIGAIFWLGRLRNQENSNWE